MSDSAMALPYRRIGVREGGGPELLPTVLFSPDVRGLWLDLVYVGGLHLTGTKRAAYNLLIVLLGYTAFVQTDRSKR